jgi:hypothetical protein
MELRKEKNKFERRESKFMRKKILFVRKGSKSLLNIKCVCVDGRIQGGG